ncbi:MAG: hypothetical protein ACLQU4_00095, partial [Limisphaerales bacterium]
MARSFVIKFLPYAIRQPRIVLKAESHFSFVILVEGQLATTDFEEEIRWRFRINIERAWDDVPAPRLPEQLISFPPNRHVDS